MAITGVSIVKQEQVVDRDATGQYVPSVRVTFTVDGQGPFSVSVPVAGYSADAVNDLITTYAAHVRGVAALGN